MSWSTVRGRLARCHRPEAVIFVFTSHVYEVTPKESNFQPEGVLARDGYDLIVISFSVLSRQHGVETAFFEGREWRRWLSIVNFLLSSSLDTVSIGRACRDGNDSHVGGVFYSTRVHVQVFSSSFSIYSFLVKPLVPPWRSRRRSVFIW